MNTYIFTFLFLSLTHRTSRHNDTSNTRDNAGALIIIFFSFFHRERKRERENKNDTDISKKLSLSYTHRMRKDVMKVTKVTPLFLQHDFKHSVHFAVTKYSLVWLEQWCILQSEQPVFIVWLLPVAHVVNSKPVVKLPCNLEKKTASIFGAFIYGYTLTCCCGYALRVWMFAVCLPGEWQIYTYTRRLSVWPYMLT